jgi:hypothetical protein
VIKVQYLVLYDNIKEKEKYIYIYIYIYCDGFAQGTAERRPGWVHSGACAAQRCCGSVSFVSAHGRLLYNACAVTSHNSVYISRDMCFLWFAVMSDKSSGHVTCFLRCVSGHGYITRFPEYRELVGGRRWLPHFLDNRLTYGCDVSLTRRPPFTPKEDSWYSFLLEAESTPWP